jgi:glycosyltransferase involved in cell wall biosynthesis
LEKNGVPVSKIVQISQGLPVRSHIELSPVVPRKESDVLKVMFIGRITPFKGVDLLIDAVCRLPAETVLLDIYGKDNDDEYARNCKKQSENSGNIFWKGTLASDLVLKTMREHDILCLPSAFSEMSPLVIQEAFAAGIPVVASNVYGNAEQITDGINGWLFRFKDRLDLEYKLRFLIDNPEKVKDAGKNIHEIKQFEAVAKAYDELYVSL